jgi:hypothetical protein
MPDLTTIKLNISDIPSKSRTVQKRMERPISKDWKMRKDQNLFQQEVYTKKKHGRWGLLFS